MENTVDLDKLTKLMNLTMSDNDHEALLALKKANSMLKTHRLHWNDLFKEKEQPKSSPKAETPKTKKITIEEIFEDVLGVVSGSTLSFVESLQTYYEDHRTLSQKQLETLLKIYHQHF